MSKRSAAEWLDDIISWGERLEGHLVGISYGDFLNDPKTQDARRNVRNRSAWRRTN